MSAERSLQPPGRPTTRASRSPLDHRAAAETTDDDDSMMFDFESDGNQADYSSSAASDNQTDDETTGQHHGNRRTFEVTHRPQLQPGRRPTNITRAIIGRMPASAPPTTTYLHAYCGPSSSIVDAAPSPPPTAPLPIPPARSTISRGHSPGPLRYPWLTRRHRVYPTGDVDNDADQSDIDAPGAAINSPISPEFRLERFYGLRYGNYTGRLEPLKPKPRPANSYHSSDTQFDDNYVASSVNSSVPPHKYIPTHFDRSARRRRTAGRIRHSAAALPRSRNCGRCCRRRRIPCNRGATGSNQSTDMSLSVNPIDALSFAAAATTDNNDAQTNPQQADSGAPSSTRGSGVTQAPAHQPFALFDYRAGMFLGNTTDSESTRRVRAHQEAEATFQRLLATFVAPAAYDSQPPAPALAPSPVLVPASNTADPAAGTTLSSYQYPSRILDSAPNSTLRRLNETSLEQYYRTNLAVLIQLAEAMMRSRRDAAPANQEEQSQEPSLESQVRQRLLENPHEVQKWRALLKEVGCGTHLPKTVFVNFGPVAQSQIPDGEEPAEKGKGKQVAKDNVVNSNDGSFRSNRGGESSECGSRGIEDRGIEVRGIDYSDSGSESSGDGNGERGEEDEEDEEDDEDEEVGGAGLREFGAHSTGGSSNENDQQDNESGPQPSQSPPSQQSPHLPHSPPSPQRRSHFKRLPRRAHRYEPYYFGELDPVPQAQLATCNQPPTPTVAGNLDTAATARTQPHFQTPSTVIAGPSRTGAPAESVPQPAVAERSPFEGLSSNQRESLPVYDSPLVVNGSSSASPQASGSSVSPQASGSSASSLDASSSSASPFSFNSSEGDTPRLYHNDTSSSELPYHDDDFNTQPQNWPSPPGTPPRMTPLPPTLPPLTHISTSNGVGELQNYDFYHHTQQLPTSFPQQPPQHSRQAYSPPLGPLPPLPTTATPFSSSIRNGRLSPQPRDFSSHDQPSYSWQRTPSLPPWQNTLPSLSSPISLLSFGDYYGEQQDREDRHDPHGQYSISQPQAPPLTPRSPPRLLPTMPSPSTISPLSLGHFYGEQRHQEDDHRPYEQPVFSPYQTPSRPWRLALTPPPHTPSLPSSSNTLSSNTIDVLDEQHYHEERHYTRRRPSSYWQQTPPRPSQQWLPPAPTPPRLSALSMPPQPQLPPLSSLLSTTQPEELGPLDYYEPELQSYFRNGSHRHRIRYHHRQSQNASPPERHTVSRTESRFCGNHTLTNSSSRNWSLMPPPPRPLPPVYRQQRSREPRIVKSYYPARR
ncbi:hypothetical protein SEPCBS57363_003832 [Sporothrix epigloea]|uniref:Uncharacterized protein n=1 Tax=Sporothrix epigloea TaxID=1892477 RepID=A0ABP0DSC7_9PEZI